MPDGIRPGRIRRSWTGWGESSGFRDCPRVASEGAGPKEDARCKGPQPLGTPGRYFRGRAVAGDRCFLMQDLKPATSAATASSVRQTAA